MLLAGTGHISEKGKKNFLVVDSSGWNGLSRLVPAVRYLDADRQDIATHPPKHTETSTSTIEAAFTDFTERADIAILLINQHVSSARRHSPCKLEKTAGWQ